MSDAEMEAMKKQLLETNALLGAKKRCCALRLNPSRTHAPSLFPLYAAVCAQPLTVRLRPRAGCGGIAPPGINRIVQRIVTSRIIE